MAALFNLIALSNNIAKPKPKGGLTPYPLLIHVLLLKQREAAILNLIRQKMVRLLFMFFLS